MSFYYHNPTCHVGFVLIAKNASSSIRPYLNKTAFNEIDIDNLPSTDRSTRWFYILRHPIERFCSGIVETYLNVSYNGFGVTPTQHAVMALSDASSQEFCFNLLTRIPIYNSRDRLPEDNLPINEGLGYSQDVHTMLQSNYLKEAVQLSFDTIPVSMHLSSDLPLILKTATSLPSNYAERLTQATVKNYNTSEGHKKRMNDNLTAILVANKENAVFKDIWDYLAPDIELWNQNIHRRFMQQHHAHEIL